MTAASISENQSEETKVTQPFLLRQSSRMVNPVYHQQQLQVVPKEEPAVRSTSNQIEASATVSQSSDSQVIKCSVFISISDIEI